ncbi:hypothetical protein [Streptomyces corynorhini]|nr:hypothetical protein [Streptomyces corynorhini]
MRHLNTPLARYGFPVLALLGAATGQYLPALVCALLGALAWKTRR